MKIAFTFCNHQNSIDILLNTPAYAPLYGLWRITSHIAQILVGNENLLRQPFSNERETKIVIFLFFFCYSFQLSNVHTSYSILTNLI